MISAKPSSKSSFFGIQTTGFRSKSYLADLILGGVNGFDNLLWSYTFASLIFTGVLAPYLPLAVGLSLVSCAVVVFSIALTSKIPFNIAGTEEQAVAILATVAILLSASIANFASLDSAAATMFTIMALSSLLLGLCFVVAARFNLGLLIQLMPYPVVCGFSRAQAGCLSAPASR